MKEAPFKNYKMIEKWLRDRTDKEFFITNTKANDITIVITRNNKLLINQHSACYMSWLSVADAKRFLEFIEQ